MEYDSAADTLRHIKRVNELLTQMAVELLGRGSVHDDSKLGPDEKPLFDEMTPKNTKLLWRHWAARLVARRDNGETRKEKMSMDAVDRTEALRLSGYISQIARSDYAEPDPSTGRAFEPQGEQLMLASAMLDMFATQLPSDVIRLVIAARKVAFEDQSQEALRELDAASEAFADRIPWEDEPTDALENAALPVGEPEQ